MDKINKNDDFDMYNLLLLLFSRYETKHDYGLLFNVNYYSMDYYSMLT